MKRRSLPAALLVVCTASISTAACTTTFEIGAPRYSCMATPAVTYGVDGVADHPSASPLTIVQVELVDAEDLVLVEASIIPGWNVASINSYPPDAATLEEHELTELWEERTPAEGAAIEANKGAELVVAVRLVEGAEAGSVADIRVHYQEAGGSQRYVGRANLGLYLVPHPSQCEEVAP